ncbi:ATP-binding protein [Bacillus sp. PS06]|uniref:ATP-binding protein n=1 Tax=Bacillus sp. PS06 TaxID=2764176 RepID=UPI0017848BEE|nr:ATP-binding protein [Bacillus sp. PS06]MBD8070708.1 ATP-binding protein [Bacillus sp. PS06]
MRLQTLNMGEIQEKDHLVRKSYLDNPNLQPVLDMEPLGQMSFVKVKGFSSFWELEENFDFDSIMSDILGGFSSLQTSFVFLLLGSPKEIGVYVGMNDMHLSVLTSSLQASYPFIKMEEIQMGEMTNHVRSVGHNGGIITGIPTNKTFGESKGHQIERLCKGMYGTSWAYMVVAKSMSPFQVNLAHSKVLMEIEDVSKFIKMSESGGMLGKESWESTNLTLQRYVDNLNFMETSIEKGRTKGMWRVAGYYLSNNLSNATKLRNLITSIYNGDDSRPEKMRTIPIDHVLPHASTFQLPANDLPPHKSKIHPVGVWEVPGKVPAKTVHFYKHLYQTILSTDELATLAQIPRKEMPGFYIDQYVEFDVADRRYMTAEDNGFQVGKIINGSEETKSFVTLSEADTAYEMELNDMNRHGLIVGITGGGKSNTSKNLLRNLWIKHGIPFMVIESAKREYWELYNMKGFEDVRVFTLGAEDEHSVPYRINPFEKMEGVPLQTHIDYVLSTFKASFELYPPMPFVLETSIYKIYEDRGWDILNNKNKYGYNTYPTLDDLYYKIDVVVDELGYDQRLKSDITAALKARIHSLRVGGKGAMLNTDKSIPIDRLLSSPVVMELEDIGDDDVKAFMMGIILVQLYEYRKTKLTRNKKFEHLILIEEAHRLLANVSGGGDASPRAKSVEFFTNLLAEIRSYGQGFLIADQVPTKLAPDTLKNTNLKIVHRIVMREDRELIGQSMNMNDNQIEYISSLKRGFAAVYAEGDTRPKLVQMPLVKEDYDHSRSDVIQDLKEKTRTEFPNYDKRFEFGPACAFCMEKCDHRDEMLKVKDFVVEKGWMDKMVEDAEKAQYKVSWFNGFFNMLHKNGNPTLQNYHTKLCTLNLILEKSDLDESNKREIVIKFMEYNLLGNES